MDPNRRRLSVARCDPVGASTGSGSSHGLSEDQVIQKIKEVGLKEVFDTLGVDKQAVSITSVTDNNKEARKSFADKDEEVLHPVKMAPKAPKDWLKERGVYWCCKKGKKPESPNQDSFSVLVVEDQFALYGVFDGHGPFGHDVSNVAREMVVKTFIQHPERATNAEKAFCESFEGTQLFLKEHKGLDATTSGTTCTLAYHDYAKQTITVAHVGDSRGVLIKKGPAEKVEVEDLTIDHKPNLPKERQRIESANPPGRVLFDGFYNHRVFAMGGMYPGLNMSRAMGDLIAHKEAGLTAMPDTRTINLQELQAAGFTEFHLLVCTDGVWEFIESKEAASITPDVEKLAKESWDRWMQDSDNEISDDITAVFVRL